MFVCLFSSLPLVGEYTTGPPLWHTRPAKLSNSVKKVK